MNKYYQITLLAMNKDARDESCPKCAFLGLCEDGYVKGVSKGNYTISRKNKGYAIAGLDIVKTVPGITPDELWLTVNKKKTPKHDGQMDVVKALADGNHLKN